MFDKKEDPENDNGSREIGFHGVHHPNIILMHNKTIARKKDGEIYNGICFTNRSIEIGEKIYIRIAEKYERWYCSMNFALTNTDPVNITEIDESNGKKTKLLPYSAAVNDVICVSVDYDATISCNINENTTFTEKLTYVSVNDPMWLVFDLRGNTRAIEISQNKPKEMYLPNSSIFEISRYV